MMAHRLPQHTFTGMIEKIWMAENPATTGRMDERKLVGQRDLARASASRACYAPSNPFLVHPSFM